MTIRSIRKQNEFKKKKKYKRQPLYVVKTKQKQNYLRNQSPLEN